MVEVKLNRIVLVLLAVTAMLLLGGLTKAHAQSVPAQPVVPMGEFEICTVNQQEEPVPFVDFSIFTEADGDVVTGFTDEDGCRIGEIIAGPARFEAGTGIIHEAVIPEGQRVFERFTVPAFTQHLPTIVNN